jgi:hypothetical protein
MSSYYTVVQYLPQPLSDERINIGVITWDEQGMSSQFATNWQRVQAFGNEDIGYLREFVAKVERATAGRPELPLLRPGEAPITPVRGSLKDRKSALTDVAPIYLTHPAQERRSPRTRRTAAKIAAQKITAAFARHDPLIAQKMVRTNCILTGKYDTHEFPVVVANGSLFAAVEALSFEVRETRTLEWEANSVLWACDDVRQENPKIRLAVFAIEPKRPSELFDRTTKVLRKLDVDLITESSVEHWANRQIRPDTPLLHFN